MPPQWIDLHIDYIIWQYKTGGVIGAQAADDAMIIHLYQSQLQKNAVNTRTSLM